MSTPQVGSGLPHLLAERYELSERLASGTMASVWRGHDRVLGRDVAIKVLHPHLAADPSFRSRFHEEAVNAARLTHPNVVALYDCGQEEDVAYIVMELVDGLSLRELLAQRGPLPPARAARLATDAALALDYAHQAGVVHRNVKPTNILVTTDGTVKVGDFSIAGAALGDDPARTGEIRGSPAYVAPEDREDGPVDGRADIYALGACLYEMLTGRAPVPNPDPAHPELRSPRTARAGIPRALDAIVTKAMAPDPDDRYPTAQAMASALSRSASSDREATTAELDSPNLPRQDDTPAPGFIRHEGRWLAGTLAVIVLAAALGVAGFLLAKGKDEPKGAGAGRPARPATTSRPLAVAAATSYDPYTSDADKEENQEDVGLAIDRQPATVWFTSGYNDDFGPPRGLKPGVGLVLDAGSPQQAAALQLALSGPGAEVGVFGHAGAGGLPRGIDPGRQLTDAGWVELTEPSQATGATTTLRLRGGASYQYYLVWFTSLPRDRDGQHRIGVAEAQLLP